MMRKLALAAAIAALSASAASAQTVGLATTKGGATEQIATALAKTISQSTDLEVRPQVLANTSQYIPLVNDGRVEFGIANFPQTYFAVRGEGLSQGQPAPNLRMVATLIPFDAGLVVGANSGIEDMAGLKGRKVPRFPPNSLGDAIISASLATAGLTYDDVTSVPMANFPAMFQAVKDGTTDVSIATVGSQPTFDIEAALGGVRFLDYKEGDGAVLAKALPGTTLKPVGGSKVPGVDENTVVFSYPYTLFANAAVPNETVAKVAKALHEGEAALKETGPIWREYDPSQIAQQGDVEYHPGAIDFYKGVGIWSGQ